MKQGQSSVSRTAEPDTRALDITQLLERQREVTLVFRDQAYRLTLTRNQKLILTK